MLAKITQFFESFILEESPQVSPQQRLNLAVAALMVEMLHADGEVTEQEQQRLQKILVGRYQLSHTQFNELTQLANEELEQATDYYQFTSLINENFDRIQRNKMIEQLWEIAFADGEVDSLEEHYLRKIADLLFVPHSEFIKAKLRVTEKLAKNKIN